MIPELLALGVAILGAIHLARMARQRRRQAEEAGRQADAAVRTVLPDARPVAYETVGVHGWSGTWQGRAVQVRTIVDTLAVRKLPSVWLSVTLAGPVPVPGTLDVMLRPAGPTTFSRFDDLAVTLPTPAGWPDEAVVRSESQAAAGALAALGHPALLAEARLKELLVTPNGVRAVAILAEADRARYGVFRQADFGGGECPDPKLLRRLLDGLGDVRRALAAEPVA
jgi:hypothetical protein